MATEMTEMTHDPMESHIESGVAYMKLEDEFNENETPNSETVDNDQDELFAETSKLTKWINKFFKIRERRSSIKIEIQAGTANFLTMSYILACNPQILGKGFIPIHHAATSTCFASFISSLICGVFANIPIGLAPGIGLSAYFSYGIVPTINQQFEIDNGYILVSFITFLSGAFLLVLTCLNVINFIINKIPDFLKISTVAGMALFLSLIGVTFTGIIIVDSSDSDSVLKLGDLGDVNIWIAFLNLVLVTVLHNYEIKGSFIISIIVTAILYYVIHLEVPSSWFEFPEFQDPVLIFESIYVNKLFHHVSIFQILSYIVSFLLVLILDVSGALFAVSSMIQSSDPDYKFDVVNKKSKSITFIAVSIGTMIASMLGCSPIIVHLESLTGILIGAKTGLTAVVTSLLFLSSIIILPLFANLPICSTIPLTIFIASLMMREITNIPWDDISIAMPAYVTIIMVPFTYSIADGIVIGFAVFAILRVINTIIQYAKVRICKKRGYAKSISVI